MNIPIPEFTEAESAIVAEVIVQRDGKPVPVEPLETGRRRAASEIRAEGHLLRRRARVLRAREEPEADQGHRRGRVQSGRRHDRHAASALPGQRYSELLTSAYGGAAKEAGLDGHLIEPAPLQRIAAKPVK